MSWTIRAGDCLELMRREPAASFDLIFADPPYHLSNGGTTCRAGRRVAVRKGSWDRSQGLTADITFHREWLFEARRVLRPSGTLWVSGTGHSILLAGWAAQEMGWHVLNLVTWFKPNAPPNLSCRTFAHSSELLLWMSPRLKRPLPHRFNYREMKAAGGGRQLRDVWPELPSETWPIPTTPAREKRHGRHPTQKPEALLERIVRSSTERGARVLDPFCGSGTTGVVAVRLGRDFVGMEREPSFVTLASSRLAEASGASRLSVKVRGHVPTAGGRPPAPWQAMLRRQLEAELVAPLRRRGARGRSKEPRG